MKGDEGVLVGFDPTLLSYRVLSKSGNIIKSKHVCLKKANEAVPSGDSEDDCILLQNSKRIEQEQKEDPPIVESSNCEENVSNEQEDQFNNSDDFEEIEIQNQLVEHQNTPEPTPEPITRRLRDLSTLKKPDQYGFHHYYEPRTIESAICCSESFLWIKAIDSEFDSIEGHEV